MNKEIGSDTNYSTNNKDNKIVIKESGVDIERNVLPNSIKKWGRNKNNIVMWETDPQTLRDYSQNIIVQAFIDTISKDVSNTDWDILDNEGNSNVSAKNFLREMHPDKTFSEVIEGVVRDLKEVGNSFLVMNRNKNGEIEEVVQPDSASIFIQKGEDGYIEGYVQRIGDREAIKINKEDIIHFRYSASSNRIYSKGAVEMSLDRIDILDELALKELLDLTEGGVSSIITQEEDHDTNPKAGNGWEKLQNKFNDSGARHKSILTQGGKINKVEIGTSYSDMQIIDRYKFHIQSLSAAFKVNASYVGLDFENSNRATDMSQRESYKQRGLKTVLEAIEQKLNRELIPELDENSEFIWDIETANDLDKVQFYRELAETVKELREANVPFTFSDGNISISEEAEIGEEELKQISEVKQAFDIISELNEDNYINIIENIVNEEYLDNEEEEKNKFLELDNNINITEKKKEVIDKFGTSESFSKTIYELEESHENRTDIIEELQEELSGTMSQSTYYNWLEETKYN